MTTMKTMPGFDLPAVRHFTEEMADKLRQCDHGEGTICSDLEQTILFHADILVNFREHVNEWAHAVFKGLITFDPAVEEVFKQSLRAMLRRSKTIAAAGRNLNGQCFELEGLPDLNSCILDLDYLLENWRSPKPSITPMGRVKLSESTKRQIADRLPQVSTRAADK